MKSQRNRQEPRRIGNAVIIAAMLLSLCVLSIIKARYCSTPFEKPDAQLEAEMNDSIRMEAAEATESTTSKEGEEDEEDGSGGVADTSKPTCFETSRRSDTCEAAGDIRVEGNTSTIFIHPMQQEWKTKPYARKHDPVAMAYVKEFTLKPFHGVPAPPLCTKNHSVPAFIFSNGGFSGNLYHDYTDVLVPLFVSTYHFKGEVQFLLSGLRSWWVNKFILIFKQLSNYEILDIDNEIDIHCFPRIVVGATFHKDMGIDPSRTPSGFSVADFKKMLRKAFGLERAVASRGGPGRKKPRLLIISRKNSRKFLNEKEMAQAAASIGFDVRIAEPDQHTDMSTFARLVNSADIMIGVHGAGLTNMVFLPRGAVVIQVVPYGGLEWLTRVTFKDPAKDMEVIYMDYNVQLDESSLSDQYPKNHLVLKDPYAVHKQGWDALKTVYLDKQNVRLNLGRFKNTLQEALKLLP